MRLRYFLIALTFMVFWGLNAQDVRSKAEAQLPQEQPTHELSVAPSNTNPLVPAGPTTSIQFEEEVHDFGQILEGELVTQVFSFTNVGDEPLIITDARGSCGCTVPSFPRHPLQPGESASLVVQFNSRNKRGMRNQKVTITANTDPVQTFLYLKGEVMERTEELSIDMANEIAEPEEETFMVDCFIIYPNPTADRLKIEVEEGSIGKAASVSIYSRTGQLMAERFIEAVHGPIEFEVSHYPAGDYVAQLQIGDRHPESRCFLVAH
ncbi:MAG: DUF1573 domain-containing protein [Bacteroidota bacterium]